MRTPKIGDTVQHWDGIYKIVGIHPREGSHYLKYELKPIPEANIFRNEDEFRVIQKVEDTLDFPELKGDKDADNYLLSQTDHS